MNKVLIGGYVVGMIQTNVYYLHREGNPETILVDPADQGNALVDAIEGQAVEAASEEEPGAESKERAGTCAAADKEREHLKIVAIFLTHAHFDHIGGVKDVVARTGAPVYISEKETLLIHDTEANLSASYHNPKTVDPDYFLRDGQKVTVAGMTLECLSTPGHTEGSCCYYIEETGMESERKCPPILLSGDTLFEESVGRTDMPTGSMSALVRSVREKLLVLPDETLVYPGHGGMTTIGHEKQFNACV